MVSFRSMVIFRRLFFLITFVTLFLVLPVLTLSARAENNAPNQLNPDVRATASTAATANTATTAPSNASASIANSSPLQRLIFSARKGFLLRMVSNEEVTAEIRNGAGRTLAHTTFSIAAGDWKLHPKNLAPGLYTVLLRTGANLRSMRMKIEDVERTGGLPEWVLEKAQEDSASNSALNSPPPKTTP